MRDSPWLVLFNLAAFMGSFCLLVWAMTKVYLFKTARATCWTFWRIFLPLSYNSVLRNGSYCHIAGLRVQYVYDVGDMMSSSRANLARAAADPVLEPTLAGWISGSASL